MRILVINPNTSVRMTDHIRQELVRIKRPDTELAVLCPERGPDTIESAYDEAIAVPPTLDLVRKANREGYDAVILACFSDPGLEAAKEISEIPVIGIEESSLHMAAMLGAKFSVITPRKERIPSKREHVHMRGLDHFLASIRSLDLSVAETDADPEKTKRRVFEVARRAVEEDGAEVIILGCAGMAGYAPEIEEKLKIKILDPSAVALKVAEAMVDLGLVHSKVGLFSSPPEKPFK
ncbi:MAG: aspartate/glutamate racemase family protein [Deltaproteobacteria bacterium]|nr:aspartate/glutamate racemase family protein [Deltaproteobacteria bacterium]